MLINVHKMFGFVQLCLYLCCVQNKYIKIMKTSATYDHEIKKAYVYEDGYEIASYDYNSCYFICEQGMSEEKKEECSNLMDKEKDSWDEFEAEAYDIREHGIYGYGY